MISIVEQGYLFYLFFMRRTVHTAHD